MKKYIGFKMIEAEIMALGDYNTFRGWVIPENESPFTKGYRIIYPDGHVSWCPADIFEKTHMQITDNNTITQQNVDEFIDSVEISKKGDKTTVAFAKLKNGFTIVESSACVDPANYDEQLGSDICVNKIRDKIWGYLGFLLQTAKAGLEINGKTDI